MTIGRDAIDLRGQFLDLGIHTLVVFPSHRIQHQLLERLRPLDCFSDFLQGGLGLFQVFN